MQGDYCHPKSGRTYRQGDPAHSYVLSHAEHGVRLDRHRREPPDDEWNRKYGPVTPPS